MSPHDARIDASSFAQHAARLQRMLDAALDPSHDAAAQAAPTHLRVRIGDRVHALAVDTVCEVVPLGRVTSLRGAPAHVRGVMPVRGAAVPVVAIDMRPASNGAQVVVVEQGVERIGVLVDGVIGLAPADDAIELLTFV